MINTNYSYKKNLPTTTTNKTQRYEKKIKQPNLFFFFFLFYKSLNKPFCKKQLLNLFFYKFFL